MKKIIVFLLSFTAIFSLYACNANKNDDLNVEPENNELTDIQIVSQSTRGDEYYMTYSASNIGFVDASTKLPSVFPVYINEYSYGQEGPLYGVSDDLRDIISDNLSRFSECLYDDFDSKNVEYVSDYGREYEVYYINNSTEVRSMMNSITVLSSEYGISDNISDNELLSNELVKAAVAYLELNNPTITKTVEYNTDGTRNSCTYVITETADDVFQHVLNSSFSRISVTKYADFDDIVLQIGYVDIDSLTEYGNYSSLSYSAVLKKLTSYYPNMDTDDVQTEIYYSANVQPGYFFPCYRFYIRDKNETLYTFVDVLLTDKE